MRFLRNNILLQFSLASLVMVVVIGVASITTLNMGANHGIDLLADHDAAMKAGTPIEPGDSISDSGE